MGLSVKNIAYQFKIKKNSIKSLWNANVRPKSVDVDKYLTLSEKMPNDAYNFVSEFKSTIANYAKDKHVKLGITAVSLPKFNMDVFYVAAESNGNKKRVAVVNRAQFNGKDNAFIRRIFDAVANATEKVKKNK